MQGIQACITGHPIVSCTERHSSTPCLGDGKPYNQGCRRKPPGGSFFFFLFFLSSSPAGQRARTSRSGRHVGRTGCHLPLLLLLLLLLRLLLLLLDLERLRSQKADCDVDVVCRRALRRRHRQCRELPRGAPHAEARPPQTKVPAAPPEAGSSVPVGRSASRALPPLSALPPQASRAVHCGGGSPAP